MPGTVDGQGERGVRSLAVMGRPRRTADGGVIYHVLNRGNARMTIFEKESDYEAFEE